jgi:hypothetical protein
MAWQLTIKFPAIDGHGFVALLMKHGALVLLFD